MNYIIESFLKQADGINDTLIEGIEDVKKKYPDIDDNTFMNIIKLDPTYKDGVDSVGTYGKWLLTLYKKIRKIPNNEITDLLKEFDTNKRYLTTVDRDIGKYKSIEDLKQKLDNIEIPEKSKTRKNKDIRKQIRKVDVDADFIGQFGNYEVYSPKSYEASCKLGQGTTWCTASNSDDSYYNSYTKDGSLYIIINTNNTKEKYQIHFESNSFMNKDDRDVGVNTIAKMLIDSPELWTEWLSKLPKNKITATFGNVYYEIQDPEIRDKYLNSSDNTVINLLQDYFNTTDITQDEYESFTYYVDSKKYVVLTDEEADTDVDEIIRIDIANDEIRYVASDSDIETSLDTDTLNDVMQQSIAEQLRLSYSDGYKESICEELYNANYLTEEDFDSVNEDEDGDIEIDFSTCNKDDDYIADMYIIYTGEDGEDYFRNIIGDHDFISWIVENEYYDEDKLVDTLLSSYGRGRWLSSYDGEEIYLGEGDDGNSYYAYRQN